MSACNAGDLGSIPGLGRSPGEGNGSPLQYSCLENPMDRGACWATVHGVAKSRTQLSDFTSLQSRIKNKMHILQITEGSMKTKTCYQEKKEIARKHNKQQAKNRMMEINLY